MTDKEIAFLEAASESGGNIKEACVISGISKPTVYRMFKSNPDFRAELDKIKDSQPVQGLGDAVKKVADATGVSKLVDKIAGDKDCGCEGRRDFLNKLPYKKVKCLTDAQYARYESSWESKKLTHPQRLDIAELHAEVFNHKLVIPCTCSPKEWARFVRDLKLMKEAYENDHEA